MAKPPASTKSKKALPPTVEVTTDIPKDPAWDGIRNTLAAVRSAGRAYLFAQAWAGWQLTVLRKSHGVRAGHPKKNSAKLAELRSWEQIVQDETGLPYRTAMRFIDLFESTQKKLKKAKKTADNKNALALFQSENPLALPPEQREHLQDVISSLCDGETQASLLRELKIVPELAPPPVQKGGKGDASKKPEDNPQLLAFHFFDGPASAICKARASAEYAKLLHLLPTTSSEQGKVSLTFLRDEAAAMVDDINAVLATHAKSANKA